MKKLPFKRRKEAKQAIPSRITNETVAEHRERILAGGRRFKYPMQYARHKLVINTIIVTLVTLVLAAVVGWWQLYQVQNTSSFFYRVTRVLPLPVASVDGQSVRYSSYLMYYNSSAHYLQSSEQVDLGSSDGKRQLDYVKRKSMDNVEQDAYAAKLAGQLGVSVSDQQVDQVITNDRNTANGTISQETYDASALSILGWSPDEYRQDAKSKLLHQAVAYAIDATAKSKADQAASLVKAPNADFGTIATQLGGNGSAKVTAGVSGMVPLTNSDGGLSAEATKLQKGAVSGVMKTTTGDGYYFVRLLDKSDTQINYEYIRIPLTKFDEQFAALKKASKIHEYISVPNVDNQSVTQ
ncbi:MAG: SurA N-terminal domain-containing protein [Candidatus Saccharimonadales bacterium]